MNLAEVEPKAIDSDRTFWLGVRRVLLTLAGRIEARYGPAGGPKPVEFKNEGGKPDN